MSAGIVERIRYAITGGEHPDRKTTRAQKIGLIPPRDPALAWLLGAKDSVDVSGDKAFHVGAYYCAINLISSVMGMLPVAFNDKTKDGLKFSTNHAGNSLFGFKPNGFQTPDVFMSTMQNWALNWGNGVAEIVRAKDVPAALVPLHPSAVKIVDKDNGDVAYEVTRVKGKPAEELKAENVLHIRNLTTDGVRGLPLHEIGERTLQLIATAESFGQAFFENGSVMSGIISHPEDLGQENAEKLGNRIEKKHQGAYRAFQVLVLDEGMTWTNTSIPPEAAQFLETRKFQVIDVSRWTNVPPVLLFDLTSGTFSNVEQLTLQFMAYTMGPWITRWENELNAKLGDEKTAVRFDRSGMEVVDMKTRNEAYAVGRNGGWYNLNDILHREGMPLLDKEIGSSHLAPSTMKTLEKTDFGNAVDMDAVTKVFQFIEANGPILPSNAIEIFKASVPNASDNFITGMITILRSKGKVTAIPGTPV